MAGARLAGWRAASVFLAVALLLLCAPGCGESSRPASKKNVPTGLKTDYVNLEEYILSIDVDLAYYTENNFTGRRLYSSPTAYLRRGSADKLKKVAGEVRQRGYRLKVLDAYRPPEVQFEMWKAAPRPGFLANPYRGFSDHSRGCAVDLTLIDAEGAELDMPSSFDEFSPRADRDYSDVSPVQKANALYLERVMVRHGFIPIRTEWWHFADSDRYSYEVTREIPGRQSE